MKIKALAGLIAAGSLALGVVFGQAMEMSGKVTAVTKNMITVQTTTGVWEVTRGSDVDGRRGRNEQGMKRGAEVRSLP